MQVFKNSQQSSFPSESGSKVILAYAISKCSKLEIFRKNVVFSEKFLKVFRSTMLGIFDLECVSEFQIAEEISKQSTFWVFRRNRCLWKEPRFFPKPVNVASFFYLALEIVLLLKKSQNFQKMRSSVKQMGNFEKQPKFFQGPLSWQKLYRMCLKKNFCFKILKSLKHRFLLEKQGVFWKKSLACFHNPFFGMFDIESVSIGVFTEYFYKSLESDLLRK